MASSLTPPFVFPKWLIFVCAAGNFGLGLGLPVSMATLFLDWQNEFKVTRAHTAAVHSTAVGILFGAAIIPGYLMNRLGARFTVLVGAILSSAGCLAGYFATSINVLIATTGVLSGLGFCFVQLPSLPVMSMAFPRYGSIMVSLCTCGSAVCNMLFPFVYRELVHLYSWRGTMMIISGVCMQTAVMGLIVSSYIKDTASVSTSQTKDETDDTKSEFKFKPRPDLVPESQTNVKSGAKEEENIGLMEEDKYNTRQNTECYEPADRIVNPECKDKHLVSFSSDMELDLYTGTPDGEGEQMACSHPVLGNKRRLHRIRHSKWKFLCDVMFILILVHVVTCLASLYSFTFIMMDFARTKGFPDDSTGAFFLFVIFIASLLGRLTIGPLNLIPHLHSIVILGLFGSVGSIGLMLLGGAEEYASIIGLLSVTGCGLGGVVAINPKCILDLESVDMKSFSLALGLACTIEGIFDWSIPILIGYSVDTTGSYATILPILGSFSLLTSLILVFTQTLRSYQAHKKNMRNRTSCNEEE